MKKNKALNYTIAILIIILIIFLALPSNKEKQEQVLKFKDKDLYTFTKTDESIYFPIKNNDYMLSFTAKPENSPVILNINNNSVTINKEGNYNLTIKDRDLLEISLKSSKATPNIENIAISSIQGEHLEKEGEILAFYHDIDKAIVLNRTLSKGTYSLEFKALGKEKAIPAKVRVTYGNKTKDITLTNTLTTTKVDLGTLEKNVIIKIQPLGLISKGKYQIINIKEIKLIKPSADKKVTISNIKLKEI